MSVKRSTDCISNELNLNGPEIGFIWNKVKKITARLQPKDISDDQGIEFFFNDLNAQ